MNLVNEKFLTVEIESIEKEKFQLVVNSETTAINKPRHGFWACIYNHNGEYKSQWHEYLIRTSQTNPTGGVLFTLKPTSKILICEEYEDFKNVAANYPLNCPDHFKGTIVAENWNKKAIIDFEKISKEYDGFFLSSKAKDEGEWTEGINTWGWDVESLVLFNLECIEDWKKIKL